MYLVMTQKDPHFSIGEIYMPHKYSMVDSCINMLDYAADIGNQPDAEPNEITINLQLWGKNLPAAALYGMMLAECCVQRSSIQSKIAHLDYMMKHFAEPVSTGLSAWPEWSQVSHDSKYIHKARGYLINTGEAWYKQYAWYERTVPCVYPHPSWVDSD